MASQLFGSRSCSAQYSRRWAWKLPLSCCKRTREPTCGKTLVRQCRKYGLRWVQPTTFPRVGVLPARVALFGAEQTWIGPFCRKVMERNFALNLDINEPAHVASILTELSLPAVDILHQAKTERVKTRLREQTEEARGRGIFGAPTFFVGNEMFWGNDRLDDALQLAAGKTSLVGIRIGEP
jgi:2-hydroxychromene-2-carboxylate isomerase